jgi:hypothetical protein
VGRRRGRGRGRGPGRGRGCPIRCVFCNIDWSECASASRAWNRNVTRFYIFYEAADNGGESEESGPASQQVRLLN